MSNYCFPKRERLVSRKLIDMLFEGSHSMAAFPLRAVYMPRERSTREAAIQLLISVPKRRFKHAVDRNRVKRQVREAFRKHSQLLATALPPDRQVLVAFVWLTDRHYPSAEIDRRVAGLLQRIAEKL